MAEKNQIKILIVDDEKDICEYVKKKFIEKGFTVFCCLSGPEAIDLVQRERPQIILLDIVMPESSLDGIATLKRIREIDNLTQCIMVTKLDDKSKVDEALSLGAVDYIVKPVRLDVFLKTVEKAAERIK